MEDRFFSCETCGNLVMMLIASGVTLLYVVVRK